MSEFSLSPTTTKKTQFSSHFISDLFLFCSVIISNPLYFSYLIFFSPYLLKLLSFLSPLFITTSLLVLALFTFSPGLAYDKNGSKFGFFQAILERLMRSRDDDESNEFDGFEELEAYKIVFETSSLEIGENPVVEEKYMLSSVDDHQAEVEQSWSHENDVATTKQESALIEEVKTLEGFLHEKEKFEEDYSSTLLQKEAKEVKPLSAKTNKVEEEQKEKPFMRSGSKAMSDNNKLSDQTKVFEYDDDVGREYSLSKVSSQRSMDSWYSPDNSQTFDSNLGSFGSMRKAKEWRRTLACKLFEERHNVDGGEGMDMLWETYETDSIKMQAKSKTKKGKKGNNNNVDYHYFDDEEEEDDEEGNGGQLCCLQALKFSAGKMNLGMGRPNLVKISKALKGIGWLHHVSKHSKKANH